MTTASLILQLIAIVASLASAYYWWRSSAKPKVVDTLPEDIEDTAFAFTMGDKHIVYDLAGQSRMSGLGAKWAAISIVAQAVSTTVVAGWL